MKRPGSPLAPGPAHDHQHARFGRRRRLVAAAAAAAVLVFGGVAVAVLDPFGEAAVTHAEGSAGADAPSLATVRGGALSPQVSESGTLGYAGPATVYGLLSGTISWLPSVGQVIKPGQTLYRVENNPVVLLDGSVPAYRNLSPGVSDGPDVKELNRNLVALGFDPDHQITVNDTWQNATTAAVERWQESLGQTQTGTIMLGQVVFLPGAQRITKLDATLGAGGGGPTSGSGSASFAEMTPVSGTPEFVSLSRTTAPTTTGTTPSTTGTTPTTTGTTPTTTSTSPTTTSTTPKTTSTSPTTTSTTPTTTTPTPKTRTATPKTRTATPKTKTATPKTRTATPKTRTATPTTTARPKSRKPPAPHKGGQPTTSRRTGGVHGVPGSGRPRRPTSIPHAPQGHSRSRTPQQMPGARASKHTAGGARSGGVSSGSSGGKSSSAGAGGPSGTPVLETTTTTRQVQVQLDASEQGSVKLGDPAQITLPDGQTTPGTVTSIGVATGSQSGSSSGSGASGPTIPVDVALEHPEDAGGLDQAPVQVQITGAGVQRALIVPLTALLALSGGRFAVETVSANGSHHLVPVALGLVDEAAGAAQVSASELRAGEQVVVPST